MEMETMLSLKELCAMLNINYMTGYLMVRRGDIPSIKVGRVYRIPKEKLNEYIEKGLAVSKA